MRSMKPCKPSLTTVAAQFGRWMMDIGVSKMHMGPVCRRARDKRLHRNDVAGVRVANRDRSGAPGSAVDHLDGAQARASRSERAIEAVRKSRIGRAAHRPNLRALIFRIRCEVGRLRGNLADLRTRGRSSPTPCAFRRLSSGSGWATFSRLRRGRPCRDLKSDGSGNNQCSYKLGKGRLRRLGPSQFSESMSFAPRNLV